MPAIRPPENTRHDTEPTTRSTRTATPPPPVTLETIGRGFAQQLQRPLSFLTTPSGSRQTETKRRCESYAPHFGTRQPSSEVKPAQRGGPPLLSISAYKRPLFKNGDRQELRRTESSNQRSYAKVHEVLSTAASKSSVSARKNLPQPHRPSKWPERALSESVPSATRFPPDNTRHTLSRID